jgi:AraC-like DNA-binding protein
MAANKEIKQILLFSKNLVLIEVVKNTLTDTESRVRAFPTFKLITDEIKVQNTELIIIDCAIKFDSFYFNFIKMLQQLNKVPFMLLSNIDDLRLITNIQYCIPDGYLTMPFNNLDLKISVILIQAKFKKKQQKRIQAEGLDDVPFGIKIALNYIDLNIFKKIVLTDLSNLTQWKKNYFIKLFLKYVGSTPYQYILEKKIDMAKSLLIQSDYPLNQISFELGFKSYTNFNNAFKKMTYTSPSNFKRVNFNKNNTNTILIDDW